MPNQRGSGHRYVGLGRGREEALVLEQQVADRSHRGDRDDGQLHAADAQRRQADEQTRRSTAAAMPTSRRSASGQPGPSTATRSNGAERAVGREADGGERGDSGEAVWASEIWPRKPMSTTEDSMIMPATSEVVSATSHSRGEDVGQHERRAPIPMTTPTQARLVAQGQRLAALDDAAADRQPVTPEEQHEHDDEQRDQLADAVGGQPVAATRLRRPPRPCRTGTCRGRSRPPRPAGSR